MRTLARVLGCEYNRIQFTPDLMPTDITGTNVFNLQRNEFTLVQGPIFTTFLLADEINRAPAKTQAALLQAMQERRVTVDRDTLSPPARVHRFRHAEPGGIRGNLPAARGAERPLQLKIPMSPPNREEELTLARRMLGNNSPEATLAAEAVQAVISPDDLLQLRAQLEAVTVREELLDYLVDVVRATRSDDSVLVGAGPRATQSLLLASRATAAISGRDYVTPDDVKAMSIPVLDHRIILRPEYEIEGVTVAEVINKVLEGVAVPR